jgi:DNA-binding transcriptional LysR family regulator
MPRKIEWESQIGRRLRLRDLHVFKTVVQRGSMAKAAQQLGVSQPAVSEVIADLEEALGVRLFDRSARGVAPTIYGDALFKRSVAAFDELQQSVRDIAFLSSQSEGELRIGCTDSLSTTILPRILLQFSERYPRIVLHLDDVGDRATEVLGPGLRDRKYDCVLQRIALPLPEQDLSDLHAEVLFEDELIIAAGANGKWAQRRKIKLAELIEEPWILPPPGTWYHAVIAKLFRARGFDVPAPVFVTHSIALRARLLAESRYISTFARSIVRMNAERYGLKILAVDFPRQTLPAGVLTLKNRTLSPVVERFLEIARAAAKEITDCT